MSWRNLAIALTVLCLYQAWRGCQRQRAKTAEAEAPECTPEPQRTVTTSSSSTTRAQQSTSAGDESPPPASATPGLSLGGFKVPAWARWLAPHPGENLLDYRDRIVPIAQAAVAPHRARVARGREDFAKRVNLDTQQRAHLDAAMQEAATAMQDKVMSSLMGGDLMPANFKPMTGVTLARDLLDTVDQANRRFMATLREDQRAALAQHPFDFADYLLFSARWEDALGVTK